MVYFLLVNFRVNVKTTFLLKLNITAYVCQINRRFSEFQFICSLYSSCGMFHNIFFVLVLIVFITKSVWCVDKRPFPESRRSRILFLVNCAPTSPLGTFDHERNNRTPIKESHERTQEKETRPSNKEACPAASMKETHIPWLDPAMYVFKNVITSRLNQTSEPRGI